MSARRIHIFQRHTIEGTSRTIAETLSTCRMYLSIGNASYKFGRSGDFSQTGRAIPTLAPQHLSASFFIGCKPPAKASQVIT